MSQSCPPPAAKRQRVSAGAASANATGESPPTSWWGACGALSATQLLLTRRALLLLLLLLMTLGLESPEKKTREAARARRRMDHNEFVSHMTFAEFARYYRVTQARFDGIVRDITPPARVLRKKRAAAARGGHGKTFIEYNVRLSLTLRYLAGASYLDLIYLHGVGPSSFYPVLWETLEELDQALPDFTLETDIHDLDRCRELAAGFAAKTDGHIVGAIAAWDGIAIKVERPSSKQVRNQNRFWCRKGFPAVSCQAACDSQRRFVYMSLEFAGSTHDARAFRNARTRPRADGTRGFLVEQLADSEVLTDCSSPSHPCGFFLLADDAYPYSSYTCVPWSRVRDRPHRDAFNYHMSRGRINIECAFGMLVKKFLVLGRPLLSSVPKVRLILSVSMKLHNVCIDDRLSTSGVHSSDYTGTFDTPFGNAAGQPRGSVDPRTHSTSGTHYADGRPSPESEVPSWYEDDIPDDLVPNRTDLEGGPRQMLTDRLQALGIRRPDARLFT